jgi:hypothetical protein
MMTHMKKELKKQHLMLKSLTAVALTLPGIQKESHAESQILTPEADVMYTRYDEGSKHYKVDVFQGMLKFPVSKNWDLSLKASTDAQAGASTYLYVPASSPVSVLWPGTFSDITPVRTGTSKIIDKRSDINANVRYFGENKTIGANFYLSEENDYISRAATLEFKQRLNKNNTEITVAGSIAGDTIKPTQSSEPNGVPRVGRKTKSTSKAMLGLKQDLTNKSYLQLGGGFIYDQGYLADPYKSTYINGDARAFRVPTSYIFVPAGAIPGLPNGGTFVQDLRPKVRKAGVFNFEFVQYIEAADSSIHFNYDFGINSWKVKSHAFTLSYYQPFCEVWEIAPSVRYYTQGQARFYSYVFSAPNSPPTPFLSSPMPLRLENSSDYRLAKFGSVNVEMILSRKFMKDKQLKVYTIVGTNIRRNGLHWGHRPNPSNWDNHITTYYISLGGTYRF